MALLRAPTGEVQEVADGDVAHYMARGAKMVLEGGGSSTAPAPGAARPAGSGLMDMLGRIETGARDFGEMTSTGGVGGAGGFVEHPGFSMLPDSTQGDVLNQAMVNDAMELAMPHLRAPAHILGSGLMAFLRRAPVLGQGVRAVEAGAGAMGKTAGRYFGRGAQAAAPAVEQATEAAAAPAQAGVSRSAIEAERAAAAEMQAATEAAGKTAPKPRGRASTPKPKAAQPVVARITPKPGAPTTQPVPARPRGASGPERARRAEMRARYSGQSAPVRGGAQPAPGDDLSKMLGNDAVQVVRLRRYITGSNLPQSMKDQLLRQLVEDPAGMARWLSQQGIAL